MEKARGKTRKNSVLTDIGNILVPEVVHLLQYLPRNFIFDDL